MSEVLRGITVRTMLWLPAQGGEGTVSGMKTPAVGTAFRLCTIRVMKLWHASWSVESRASRRLLVTSPQHAPRLLCRQRVVGKIVEIRAF